MKNEDALSGRESIRFVHETNCRIKLLNWNTRCMEIKSNQIHKLISKRNSNRDIPRSRGPTQPRHAPGRLIQIRTGMMHQISTMNCSCLLEIKSSDYNILLINFMSLIWWISPKYKFLNNNDGSSSALWGSYLYMKSKGRW